MITQTATKSLNKQHSKTNPFFMTNIFLPNDILNCLQLIDYGATIVSIKVPNNDKPGSKVDLVLGYDDIDGYLG